MKIFRCERGLAMIETVIATSVIAILCSIAVPRLSRMLDEVCVDYEIRCLHSALHYTQSVSRISQYQTFRFGVPTGYSMSYIECYMPSSGDARYVVRRPQVGSSSVFRIKEYHYLERGATLNNPITDQFRFRANGEFYTTGGTLTLSKGKSKRYIALTNYGRIRITDKKP